MNRMMMGLPVASLVLALAGGCATGQKALESAAATEPANTAAATASNPTPANANGSNIAPHQSSSAEAQPQARSALPPHRANGNAVNQRSVYFDYDQFVIRPESMALLKSHADYLNRDKAMKIQVQGHADERGSREYNLALAQKRADAVRKALSGHGITNDRVESVSLGEEKPKAAGHDETAWAENRRGDILYVGEF